MVGRVLHALLLGVAVFLLTFAFAATAQAGAAELWVGQSAGCSDARTPAQAGSAATPWCTLTRAAAQARGGDTVHVGAGVYRETLRPLSSGTPSAPVTFAAAAPGVVIDANGAANGVKMIGVNDIVLDGLEVRGASGQGVWLDATARVTLAGLTVTGNAGAGVTVKASSQLVVDGSTISGNGGAGIMELAGTSGGRYTDDTISGNGIDGLPYNGDGIQLGGVNSLVARDTITGNGDPGPYEHGVYTGASSSGWTIEDNTIADNAAAGVKAAGGPGQVRFNRIEAGRYGIVLSDNPAVVTVEHNAISGAAQHLVFLTTGTTAARARLWSNTIDQTGRSADSGDASAVFVNAAAWLELRDNLICYSNPDSLGVALWVNDASRLSTLASDTNWFCGTDAKGRDFAWNGSRTTLDGWRAAARADGRSVDSAPPVFAAGLIVTSADLGAGVGDNLGLATDLAGAPIPASGPVDIGAYQR
ncbi:MAG TPA: right-handed parallel beta-helix repeat-containing protein [Conexibacter sp.]|jgi:parallel beta-helix repeat protein